MIKSIGVKLTYLFFIPFSPLESQWDENVAPHSLFALREKTTSTTSRKTPLPTADLLIL